ncbi:MAG: ROK family protein [Planctomycetes bacterium]|nr:ROK family protein [Planctomycetota bacterium]
MHIRGGIDLGGTKIQAVIVDHEHRVLGEMRTSTPHEGGPSDVAATMAATLGEAAKLAGVETSALLGVGVGSPGFVDARNGTVARAGNLPRWQEPFHLAAALSEALGAPVELGNDVGVALDGESFLGAGRPYDSFVGVFWGTGIGGGVILHHQRWLGRGAAGELGHMVIKRNGARCPCGRRGCVEAYAGRRAMEARARRDVERGEKTELFDIMEKKGRTQLSAGVFAKALEKHDRYTEWLIERALKALGAGLASACTLLDVEAIVVGGGLGVRLGQPYAEKIRDAMLPHLFTPDRPPAIHVAELGDRAGAIGASLLVPGAKGENSPARRERNAASRGR